MSVSVSVPVDVVSPPPVSRPAAPLPLAGIATVLAVLIAGWWAGRVAVQDNHHEDLWIYSAASRMAFAGTSPYSTERAHAAVAEQFTDPDLLKNAAYLRPPATLLVFAPFTGSDWLAAKLLWCAVTILLGALAAWHLSAFTNATLPPWFAAAAVVVVLCNPLTLFVLIVGQTPLFVIAAIVLGQAAHRRGRVHLGAALWALAFIKPHVAIPLIPLAWYLGGWRRAAEVVAFAGAFNLLAGVLTVGSPLLVLDYLKYLPEGHRSVSFNLVGGNEQITSWNRLVLACGGPAIDLGLTGTLAGYAVWGGLVCLRTSQGLRPGPGPSAPPGRRTDAWLLAVAACGSLLCCQSLPYELPMLVLVLPYLGELFVSGRGRDQAAALVIGGFVAFAMLPGGGDSLAETFAHSVGGFVDQLGERLGVRWNLTAVLLCHRSLGVLLVSVAVLARGPVLLAVRQPAGGSVNCRDGIAVPQPV